MRASILRRLAVVLASTLCWGCFVFDEIDAGQKEMDRYGGKPPDAKGEAAAAKDKEPTPAERARQWWDSARTFEPRSDDAKSDIVSCKVGGAVRFMSQSDCTNSGGRVSGG
ncbi:MAG TPA: hypothetical protein VII72_08845 [Myxococcota bacterium]|jgi:hypothetical protein